MEISMTYLETKFEILWLPPSDESFLPKWWERNPMPSKMKIWDYYIEKDWWQRRYITMIDWTHCTYDSYYLDDYNSWWILQRVELPWWRYDYVKKPLSSWIWRKYNYPNWYCSKSHIRSWSQK